MAQMARRSDLIMSGMLGRVSVYVGPKLWLRLTII